MPPTIRSSKLSTILLKYIQLLQPKESNNYYNRIVISPRVITIYSLLTYSRILTQLSSLTFQRSITKPRISLRVGQEEGISRLVILEMFKIKRSISFSRSRLKQLKRFRIQLYSLRVSRLKLQQYRRSIRISLRTIGRR